jgi:hypothetical protein
MRIWYTGLLQCSTQITASSKSAMLCFVFGPPRIYASRYSRLALQDVEEGSNYLHRSPAGLKRRRKGNPVPAGITGTIRSWEKYEDLGSRLGESRF